MKIAIKYIITLFVLMLFLPLIANADTKKLRLQTYLTKLDVIPIGFVKAPAFAIMERRGVAVYEDGEVATYLMRGTGRFTPKGGTAEGFSQYTYNDGSTSVVKWQAQLVKKEGDKLMAVSGKGSYVSGTGRLKGIQGDMTFTGKYVTPYSKEKGMLGDMIVDVISNYTLPPK
ncbi:hypothetical protein [Anaerotignum sp.]|jgi:hypothetical protein|uniref:hypothetical protein n=1 Tax=Anaerotignum sp. TaxID=2039241 RepID=UPI002714B39E|nr:hypothetical protein [Anaerotignum sp.]